MTTNQLRNQRKRLRKQLKPPTRSQRRILLRQLKEARISAHMEQIIEQSLEAQRPEWQKQIDAQPLRVQPLYMSQRDHDSLMADLETWHVKWSV